MSESIIFIKLPEEPLERFVSAFERIAEAYEAQVVAQSNVANATVRAMEEARKVMGDR